MVGRDGDLRVSRSNRDSCRVSPAVRSVLRKRRGCDVNSFSTFINSKFARVDRSSREKREDEENTTEIITKLNFITGNVKRSVVEYEYFTERENCHSKFGEKNI